MNTPTPTLTDILRAWMAKRLLGMFLIACSLTGCAAFHPIRGVPAPYLPHEYLGPSRSGKKTIDLSLLVQTQPDQYRVAAGDTLAIYIPGVLGSLNVEEDRQIGETPPITVSSNPLDPPTIGYPITVRDDGTIALPYIAPVNVQGMTLPDIELAIRKAYTEETHILNGKRDRVLVSLQRRREVSVIVVRQETSSELTQGAQSGSLNVGSSKRGTARTVRLPAYENDVLHALANSQQGADGLPGLDAKNTIYIIRRKRQPSDHELSVRFPSTPETHDERSSTDAAPSERMPTPPLQSPGPMLELTPRRAPQVIEPSIPEPTPAPQIAPPTVPAFPPYQRNDATPAPSVPDEPQTVPPRSSVPTVETQPQPQRPQQPQAPATPIAPQEAGQPPAWPAPAQPAPSIQRTSGQRPAVSNAWPQVRGQSPGGWSLDHSSGMSGEAYGTSPTDSAYGYPTASPQSPSFGHGAVAPSVGAPMTGYGEMPQADPWGQYPADSYGPPLEAAGRRPYQSYAEAVSGHDDAWREALAGVDPTVDNANVIKIPIRLAEGERPTFTERDIILHDGDIVFIESRETEVFYTGGLLGGGQYTLPRDYDLRVLEAISIAQSPRNNRQSGRGIGGVSALNQDVTISASHVVILRTLPNGTRIPIEVDLYKAVRRPQENILVQPGDLLILQYTKVEAVGAFIERNLLEGAIFGLAASQLTGGSNGN